MDKERAIELLKKDVSKWNEERSKGYFDLSNADLSNADLSNADLRYADLWYAYLSNANLSNADLSNANLRNADLRYADLSNADLRNADLSNADLWYADLSNADLWYADLSNANLSNADLSNANLPAPTAVLLANWGEVSDELTLELMRYDAEHHQDPEAFDKWAAGGPCPYKGAKYQRAANFREKRELWKPGRAPRGFDLMVACIKEKCKDSDYHE